MTRLGLGEVTKIICDNWDNIPLTVCCFTDYWDEHYKFADARKF